MEGFFHFDHAMVADVGSSYQLVQRFINSHEEDVFLEKINLTISTKTPYQEIILRVKGLLDEARCVAYTLSPGHFVMLGKKNKKDILVLVDNRDRNHTDDEDDDEEDGQIDAYNVAVSFYGPSMVVTMLREKTREMHQTSKLATINWWYQTNHGQQSRKIYLQEPKTELHPEFYPDLGDPQKFIDEYLASDASVLMLSGVAGTGKTTLLRHMIAERKLGAHLIFDEGLMTKDTIFHQFLFSADADIMIIEDADTILTNRELEGNKMMARFLSVADGLVKVPNKKLIFTTNLTDFNKVDAALLRPGRCHAMVNLRPLDLQEAQAAAKVANLPIPTEKRVYTLAELFNQGYRPKLRSIGFGRG